MKKAITLAFGLYALIPNLYSQNSKLAYREGNVIALNVNSWTNDLIYDPKFIKQKQEKRDEQILAFNAKIVSGQLPPQKLPLTYKVFNEPTSSKDLDSYRVTTNIGGKDYSSFYEASKDTMYIYRNKGVITSEVGFTIQGVQKIPFNLKVGDKLPMFEDVGMMYPTSTNQKVKEQVSAGLKTKTTNEVGVAIGSDGNVINGQYQKTSTYEVYNSIETEVRKTLQTSLVMLFYVNAEVTKTEEVKVAGKTYTAYVIDSEIWSKSKTDRTYESERASAANMLKAQDAKLEAKMGKKMVKWGFNNAEGYMVMFKQEWFVPEFGVVRVRVYDTHGGISSDSELESVM